MGGVSILSIMIASFYIFTLRVPGGVLKINYSFRLWKMIPYWGNFIVMLVIYIFVIFPWEQNKIIVYSLI